MKEITTELIERAYKKRKKEIESLGKYDRGEKNIIGVNLGKKCLTCGKIIEPERRNDSTYCSYECYLKLRNSYADKGRQRRIKKV